MSSVANRQALHFSYDVILMILMYYVFGILSSEKAETTPRPSNFKSVPVIQTSKFQGANVSVIYSKRRLALPTAPHSLYFVWATLRYSSDDTLSPVSR